MRAAEAKMILARDQRIEAKLTAGTNPNKGTVKLAENNVITALSLLIPMVPLGDCVFSIMMQDFRKTLVFYTDQPGFSNLPVFCVG